MSCGIVRVAKMGAGSVKGIQIHDRREKEGISHTNKDIDWERSKDNYDLHEAQNENFNHAVKERIEQLELTKAVRKDAVVMAQVLVTSDHAFFDGLSRDQQEQFFKDSYDFLSDRYGKENIISATVHLDERTPHMHFNFVPVTEDGRLSAKQILTRSALIEQQTAFQERVGKKYGLERGVERGYQKHYEMAEFKAVTKAQEAADLEKQVTGLKKEKNTLQEKSAAIEDKITRNLIVADKIKHLPQGKKTLLGKIELTKEEFSILQNTAKAFYKSQARAEEMTDIANRLYEGTSYKNLELLSEKVNRLEKANAELKVTAARVPDIEQQLTNLRKNLNWYKGYYDDQMLNIVERVGDKGREWLHETVIPKWAREEVEKDLVKALHELIKPKSRGIDLEL